MSETYEAATEIRDAIVGLDNHTWRQGGDILRVLERVATALERIANRLDEPWTATTYTVEP